MLQRHSRRSRLDDLTPLQLFHIGRERLVEGEVENALVMLRGSAQRGHEEAAWLVGRCDVKAATAPARLPVGSRVSEWKTRRDDVFEWLRSVFSRGETSDTAAEGRELFYEAQFLPHGELKRNQLVQLASHLGCARAMAEWATDVLNEDVSLAQSLLERAAALDEPYAMYQLAAIVQQKSQLSRSPGKGFERECIESFRLYLRSAELGLVASFGHLADIYSEGTYGLEVEADERKRLFWSAREAAFSSCSFPPKFATYFGHPRSSFDPGTFRGSWLGNLFWMGREFDRCETIGIRLEMREVCDRLAEFYNSVCHAARWAALTPYPFLKQRLGRDMAQLIGKKCYATRCDDEMLEEWRDVFRRM